MKESAQAAFSYIRSRADELEIDPNFHEKHDIHIHVPEGAIPKDGLWAKRDHDGDSLGLLLNGPTGFPSGRHDRRDTLRGRVLPIGGLKEKALSAHRAGITNVLFPEENKKDLEDIPESVRKDLKLIPVSHMDEVLKLALVSDKSERDAG